LFRFDRNGVPQILAAAQNVRSRELFRAAADYHADFNTGFYHAFGTALADRYSDPDHHRSVARHRPRVIRRQKQNPAPAGRSGVCCIRAGFV
jgi:hypothetical protein